MSEAFDVEQGAELQWEAPSGRATASGANAAMAARLRERPDEWAIIESHPVPEDEAAAKKARAQMSNRASLISQGRIATFTPRGAYEAASRSKGQKDADGNPVIRVYARYLGQAGVDAMARADADKAAAKAGVQEVGVEEPVGV